MPCHAKLLMSLSRFESCHASPLEAECIPEDSSSKDLSVSRLFFRRAQGRSLNKNSRAQKKGAMATWKKLGGKGEITGKKKHLMI